MLALALPVALAAAATLARPAPPGTLAARALPGPGCAAAAGAAVGSASGTAWYRLDPVLDTGGTLAGQRLTAGRGEVQSSFLLPAESFASGPAGGRVLVGDDDGRRSRLRLLDTATGCWTVLGTSPDVVRSALLAPDGSRIYEHRLERATRRDLGVWERGLGAAAPDAAPVLAGIAADAAYGPTFTTSLLVADDGRLAVSSCGERACRTRVLDPATRRVASFAGTGPAAGMIGERMVAPTACDALPCTLAAIDAAPAAATGLGDARGPALVAPGGSDAIVIADAAGLGVVRLGTPTAVRHVPGSAGLAPLPASSTADSGAEAPRGSVAVAPGGRVDDPAAIRFLDPSTLQFTAGEVLP